MVLQQYLAEMMQARPFCILLFTVKGLQFRWVAAMVSKHVKKYRKKHYPLFPEISIKLIPIPGGSGLEQVLRATYNSLGIWIRILGLLNPLLVAKGQFGTDLLMQKARSDVTAGMVQYGSLCVQRMQMSMRSIGRHFAAINRQ